MENTRYKRMIGLYWIVSLIMVGLYIFLVYLTTKLATDVTFGVSDFWIYVLEISYQLIELAVFWIAFALAITCLWKRGARDSVFAFISIGALTVIKYIANFSVSWIVDGAYNWVADLLLIVQNIGLEIALLGLPIVICGIIIASRKKHEQKGSPFQNGTYLPYRHIVDFANPLLTCALICSLTVVAVKTVIWLYYFATVLVDYLYKPWVILLEHLFVDLLFAVLGYFAVAFMVVFLAGHFGSDKKKKDREEADPSDTDPESFT